MTKTATSGICNCCSKKLTSIQVAPKHFEEKNCPNAENMMKYGSKTIPTTSINTSTASTSSSTESNQPEVQQLPFESGYVLKLTANYTPKTWWMLVSVPRSLDLGQLDHFLRTVWCECGCGHMSSFSSESVDFLKFEKKLFQLENERKIEYMYDFGSSTYVHIEFLHLIKAKVIKPNSAVVLARNSLPTGYPSTINSPRATEGHGLCPEVIAINCVFDLPPGSGDESSRAFRDPYGFDDDEGEEGEDEEDIDEFDEDDEDLLEYIRGKRKAAQAHLDQAHHPHHRSPMTSSSSVIETPQTSPEAPLVEELVFEPFSSGSKGAKGRRIDSEFNLLWGI